MYVKKPPRIFASTAISVRIGYEDSAAQELIDESRSHFVGESTLLPGSCAPLRWAPSATAMRRGSVPIGATPRALIEVK